MLLAYNMIYVCMLPCTITGTFVLVWVRCVPLSFDFYVIDFVQHSSLCPFATVLDNKLS